MGFFDMQRFSQRKKQEQGLKSQCEIHEREAIAQTCSAANIRALFNPLEPI